MSYFAKKGVARKTASLGLVLAFAVLPGHAAGLPEWGMSSGPAAFMIEATAIKSPPLGSPAVKGNHNINSPQVWTESAAWLEGYEVSLTNVTRMRWDQPVIQYVVYAMDADGSILQIHGIEELNEIPVNGQITLITNQVLMQRVVRSNGHSSLPGRLLGVRLRIYTHKNELIEDYAAPWDLMVWQKWTYPLSTEGGGLIKPRQPGLTFGG